MKIKPLHDYVLLKMSKHEDEITKSGLIIPKTAQQRPRIAEVVAFGNEVTGIKKKDKVTFYHLDATVVKDGDEEYLLLVEEDILAIIED